MSATYSVVTALGLLLLILGSHVILAFERQSATSTRPSFERRHKVVEKIIILKQQEEKLIREQKAKADLEGIRPMVSSRDIKALDLLLKEKRKANHTHSIRLRSITEAKERLECLSKDMSEPSGTWVREDIFGNVRSKDHWAYQPGSKCDPLESFDVEAFCRSVLKCQNMLLVGDSTMLSFYRAGTLLLTGGHEVISSTASIGIRSVKKDYLKPELAHRVPGTEFLCPVDEKSDYLDLNGTHAHVHRNPDRLRDGESYVQHRSVCSNACTEPVNLAYVHHNYLIGHPIHLKKNRGVGSYRYFVDTHDALCDYWQDELLHGDYGNVIFSSGAHVPRLIQQAFLKNENATNEDVHKLIQQHADEFTKTFQNIIAEKDTVNGKKKYSEKTTLIWKSARWGVTDFTTACNAQPQNVTKKPYASNGLDPSSTWPEVYNRVAGMYDTLAYYMWDYIPILNNMFRDTLQATLPSDSFLLWNISEIESMRTNCRIDTLHWQSSQYSYTPDWYAWHHLYNLLSAFKMATTTTATTDK